MLAHTDGVAIQAPPSAVWPWLAQMGYDRAGWRADPPRRLRWVAPFLLALLAPEERAGYVPRREPSADRIVAEFQTLCEGDQILDGPPGTTAFTGACLEPNRALVLISATGRRLHRAERLARPDCWRAPGARWTGLAVATGPAPLSRDQFA